MSYISFYRKWRPQTFSEIIGQEYVVQTLENAITKNRISHAYIFCGPRGTGKTSLARIFAKALNCEKGPTSKPCNKCENCISISNGSSMDVVEIDAASNRGINEIRELREKVKYLPTSLRKKVYIIDEVHMLTTEAFNALLKVLEEPPEHVIFIMATTEPHQVLATIMSRCQRFDFYPIPQDKIRKRLKDVSSSEDISISDSALNLIARYADGSLRDADGILEQLSSLGENDVNVDDVSSLLGVIDIEMLFELANILIEKNLNQALLFIHRIISSSVNLKIFVSEFLDHLYNLYVLKNYDNPLEILDIGEDYKEKYFDQAKLFSKIEVEFLINLYSELLKQLRWSDSAKSYFKAAIIKSVNYRYMDEEQTDNRFKKISSDIDSLKNEILKANSSFRQSIKTDNKSGIQPDDKTVDKTESKPENKPDTELEPSKKPELKKHIDTAGKSADKAKPADEKTAGKQDESLDKKGDIKIKKAAGTAHDEYEKAINDNWNRIISKLKEKNVPLHAKFMEVKDYKVENNTVYFYLEKDKKWHTENLNKANNATFIQGIIKEVTNKDFKVVFEIQDNNGKADGKKNGNDIFNYIEEKFGIKEK